MKGSRYSTLIVVPRRDEKFLQEDERVFSTLPVSKASCPPSQQVVNDYRSLAALPTSFTHMFSVPVGVLPTYLAGDGRLGLQSRRSSSAI
jgi:hypothetical protein